MPGWISKNENFVLFIWRKRHRRSQNPYPSSGYTALAPYQIAVFFTGAAHTVTTRHVQVRLVRVMLGLGLPLSAGKLFRSFSNCLSGPFSAVPGPASGREPSQAGLRWRLRGGFGPACILEKPKPSRQAAAFQWAIIAITGGHQTLNLKIYST